MMRSHWFGGLMMGCALALFASLPVPLQAQAPGGPDAPARGRGRGAAPAGGAQGRGGRGGRGTAQPAKPPAGPPPRLADGTINLDAVPGQKGFWNSFNGQIVGKKGNALPTNLDIDEVPFQPWAKMLYQYRVMRGGLDDPHSRCQPAGGTRFLTVPNGTEFIQQPELNRIIMIDGENRNWKRIAMEPGRKHPSADDLNPSYFGDSIGHWEGDTLVVDTVGFNEKFWALRNGMPATRFLHLIERYTRVDMDRINYEVTVDDKGAYTKPWSGGWYINWQSTNYDNSPGGEIHEYFCIDNEQDSQALERQ
jgi:hypothetical protein